MPYMEKLGLGHIEPIQGIKNTEMPIGHYGKMQEASNGKDTMTGHWEIMGLHIKEPFQVFPDGFPPDLIADCRNTSWEVRSSRRTNSMCETRNYTKKAERDSYSKEEGE